MTASGLDLTTLRALRGRGRDHTPLVDRIATHLEAHDGYVAFSGGKDSTAALHLARQADPAVPVVWFDSGLEYPETSTYVTDLADKWSLNLTVIHPRIGLLELLQGCGAWNRTGPTRAAPDLHHALIVEPSRRAHDQFGAGEILGVRAAESSVRTLHFRNALARASSPAQSRDEARAAHGGVVARRDGTVAFSPLWDWTTPQAHEYLAAHRVPLNPVYDKFARLGVPEHEQRLTHLIDGSYLERGRATWLRQGWPTIFDQLVEVLPRLADYV